MVENIKNIGPSAIDTGGDFILSKSEILTVQRYVNSGVNLPTDIGSLNKLLKTNYPRPDDLNKLFGTYKNLHDHCKYWRDNTLPSMVGCAADIVHYNEKVPIYYGKLYELLPLLDDPNPGEQVVKKYRAIITDLSTTAKGYAEHAASVSNEMTDFAHKCEADSRELSETKGYYDKLFGTSSEKMTLLLKQLTDANELIKKLNNKYEHDVTVAATSATYVWIFPLGTIAAAVVAGVYGSDATEDQKQIRKTMENIRDLEAQEGMYTDIITDLHQIESNLGDIQSQLNDAIPIIQKIQGVWVAISTDLNNILDIIDKDIDKVPAIIKDLGIEEAIKSWDKVAKIADKYRVNAFITVSAIELEEVKNVNVPKIVIA